MESFNRQKHWENIYTTKALDEVSWYQPNPETSLSFFSNLRIPKNSRIIDVGGGDSFLVDYLIDLGYTDITVLDISESAINRVKNRLGQKAENVKWVVSDIIKFKPSQTYDVWHDRAAFHFLKHPTEIKLYSDLARSTISSKGHLLISTFSDKGPLKCSGIEIQQYSEKSLIDNFSQNFQKIVCFSADHLTPFDTTQNFIFCAFKKK